MCVSGWSWCGSYLRFSGNFSEVCPIEKKTNQNKNQTKQNQQKTKQSLSAAEKRFQCHSIWNCDLFSPYTCDFF